MRLLSSIVRLFSYVLYNFKNITVKLLFCAAYLYIFSIMLAFLSHGFQYAVEIITPTKAFHELYTYLRMCYNNRSHLGYGILIRTVLALLTPNFLYRLFLSINWRMLYRKVIAKYTSVFRKGGKTFFNKENFNFSTEYEHDIKLVNTIKQLLMHDIEQIIDKRLYDIFLSKKYHKD